MRAEQTYSINFGAAAVRGWCLMWVDDAGNAPTRTETAEIAREVERRAGRLQRGDNYPMGVWVVVFFSLTRGPYVGLGHVAFLRKSHDGSIEIRDSEVASGARVPYGSIEELLVWFDNHDPIYEGWSTSCDGRTYVKIIGRDEMDKRHVQSLFQHYQLREPNADEYKKYTGTSAATLIDILQAQSSAKDVIRWAELGRVADKDQWQQQIKNKNTENSKLKKSLDQNVTAQKLVKIEKIIKE